MQDDIITYEQMFICYYMEDVMSSTYRLPEELYKDGENIFILADLFKMFADPTRLGILTALYEKELCVCEIAEELNMNQSAISHQLRLLKQCGLVRNRRNGKHLFYSLADSHVSTIIAQGYDHISE